LSKGGKLSVDQQTVAEPLFKPLRQLRVYAERGDVIVTLGLLTVLLLSPLTLRQLPVDAITTGDSAAYLAGASFRPPLYGWLLNSWLWLHGDLTYLSIVQAVMLLAALGLFAVEFGLMMRNAAVAAATGPLVLVHPDIRGAPYWMMTECLFIVTVLAGMALMFRYARRGDGRSLIGAAILFGLAAITRNTGMPFLLLPVAAALLDRRWSLLAGLRHAALTGVTATLVMLSAMIWHAARDGHFEVGTWGGISLLTKALLLVQPSDVEGLPPPIQAVVPYAERDRELIAAQPDIAARLRAHVQAVSGDLRWAVFAPDAEATWPAWQHADWRLRGQMAGEVSKTLIRRHPLGALRLWADDWLALVLQPAYWPPAMTATIASQSEYIFCGKNQNCWGLSTYHISTPRLLVLLAVSLLGPAVALALLVSRGVQVLIRRRAGGPLILALRDYRVLIRPPDSQTILFWLTALVIHASLAVAAIEAGAPRYTIAIYALEVPLLIWVAARLGRWVRERYPKPRSLSIRPDASA
jgi:hypothetical protein